MILPSNGKVIIIDDQFKEVKPLIKALTQEGMPFLYFKDQGGDDLPDEPIDDVRLVFLDLDHGLGGLGAIENIRYVQNRLYKIIKPDTPYILVIWSTHEDQYKQTLVNEFEGVFNSYKPIACCSLDKFTLLNGPVESVVSTIRSELKRSLNDFEAFNAFLLWESIVTKSCGEIVNGFTKIFELNNSWNDNLKAFFYRLALANVGKEKLGTIGHPEKLRLALLTITSALTDSIEKNTKVEISKIQLNIEEKNANITKEHLISINTKLHLIESDFFEHFHPGNLYYRDFTDDKMLKDIVSSRFGNNVQEIIDSKPIIIQVDVTPSCDYAQDKGYSRLLTGIIINKSSYDEHKGKKDKNLKKKDYLYIDCPILNIYDNDYYLIFDFRHFKSMKQELVKTLYINNPKYRIRSQLLIDLQSSLSNHINRPGIISVI